MHPTADFPSSNFILILYYSSQKNKKKKSPTQLLRWQCYNSCLPKKFLVGGTDRAEQTVSTQIRLLLEEQSDQGLHCLPFHLHILDTYLYCKTKQLCIQDSYYVKSPNFRFFTVSL